MLTLLANAFRIATRTDDDPNALPPRHWQAPPHWHLPVRDLPGRDRF